MLIDLSVEELKCLADLYDGEAAAIWAGEQYEIDATALADKLHGPTPLIRSAQEFFSELLFRTKGTTSGADFMQEAYGVAQDMGLEEVPTEEEPPDRESEGLDDLSDADIEELGGFVEDLDKVMP
jgi:hypothetical protein